MNLLGLSGFSSDSVNQSLNRISVAEHDIIKGLAQTRRLKKSIWIINIISMVTNHAAQFRDVIAPVRLNSRNKKMIENFKSCSLSKLKHR